MRHPLHFAFTYEEKTKKIIRKCFYRDPSRKVPLSYFIFFSSSCTLLPERGNKLEGAGHAARNRVECVVMKYGLTEQRLS